MAEAGVAALSNIQDRKIPTLRLDKAHLSVDRFVNG